MLSHSFTCQPQFQSTPSAGRATTTVRRYRVFRRISIHALRGEGDCAPIRHVIGQLRFQSTPSAGRATSAMDVNAIELFLFQSTPSAGRATGECVRNETRLRISIHALRGEGDHEPQRPDGYFYDFNPRPPRGGRLASS